MARSSITPQSSALVKRPRFRVGVPLGWFWPLFWSGLMMGSGILGIWAMAWLTRIPPLPDCEDITAFSSASNRLICAQTEMQSGSARNLAQAIQLTANWPQNNPLQAEASPVLLEASQRLLKKATEKMHQGDLTTAVEWASEIPLDTPLRQTAQAAIWDWQQEWKKGASYEKTIQQAIASRNWSDADNSLQQLKLLASDYWLSKRHGDLQKAMQREQTAWAQIEEAQALANTGDPEKIGEALVMAQRVDLTSQAWKKAQEDIDRWSQNLLLYSFQRWELGDVEGAIATVQKVPPDPNLAPEARDLIRFSHAKQLADKVNQQWPGYMQLFHLMEAIRAVEHIGTDSTFYGAAQQSLTAWQAQLDDLRTLQFAHVVASFRQPWAFKYATQLAWAVEPERPRRLQAQTLIAHWEDEIERLEDRPYLLEANALAQKGTIEALQSAIEEARQVALGRALRIEAQTAIASWTNQIEVIQDQPLLNEANTLANEGNLREAIAVAQGIHEERALYKQAQSMIQDWTHTVQLREDRPILKEAEGLAYEGSLTRAINLASQIAPGRALYSEAQTAIALWEAEREYILFTRESESATTDYQDSDDQPWREEETTSQPPPPTSNDASNE
ncbi:MAG: hypothetical protein AAGE59_03515 [Cyanobacteria bacterium P01_F01_bin.86]